jgi:hypothetical protein
MYYEAICHKEQPVKDATQAAELIKEGKIPSYITLSWNSPNGKFFAVSDTHIDDSAFAETAIIEQKGNEFFLKDSITVGWVKSTKEVIRYFSEAETAEAHRKTQLILNEPKEEKAFFTCGCCGEYFKDSVKKQIQFDQDLGFGICNRCAGYYS